MDEKRKATIIGIVTNIFLLAIKGLAAFLTGSIAILSDTLNSFLDLVSSIATHVAVKLSKRQADKGYPYGYRRAEPIAALLIAFLAAILAFEIIRNSITGIISGKANMVNVTLLPVIIMFTAIFIKIIISNYFQAVGKKHDSPALIASSTDFKNDVMASTIALIGLIGKSMNVFYLDDIAAIMIAGMIFYSGYRIGIKNLDYLMGKSPDDATLFEIKRRALSVDGVKHIDEVKAHYVGNYIHVELKIHLDKNLKIRDAHVISEKVRSLIESISHIDKVYVHVHPA